MKRLVALALLVLTVPASAQDIKPFCPDRGAIQTCIVDKGHIQVETSLVNWSDDQDSTLLLGDTVVRYGINDLTEVQLGMSPMIRKSDHRGNGDLKLTVRRNLIDKKFSLAVQTTVIAPTGSQGITAGHWGAGAAVAAMYDATPSTQFYVTPAIYKLPDILVSNAVGVNHSLSDKIGVGLELYGQHRPHETQASVDFTTTWTARSNLEFDASANVGVTDQTPNIQLVVGISRRF